MINDEFIYFKCLELEQPIGVLYIGAILFNEVISISYADVRRIERRDLESYIGIQRPLEEKRVKELRSYVTTIDSSFPTSVILAVSSRDAVFDREHGIMRIRKNHEVARIIDGQHRIAGLINYSGPPFYLNVTIFVDMDVEDQAHLFATINLKQTKVNRSLAWDLFEFAKARSPQKTAHNIAKFLDQQEGSPFYRRVKILGVASGRGTELLTQAAIVERLLVHLSKDPMRDRDDMRRGKVLVRATREEETDKKLFFRNMFIEERDEDIALVEWNFFTAVAKRWPSAWDETKKGYILNKGAGFSGLSRILSDVYIDMDKIGSVPTVEEFSSYLLRSDLEADFFVRENFLPGSGGEGRLYRDLKLTMKL